MAIPTSYTADEFADYLKDEVFLGSAQKLGLDDLVKGTDAIYQDLFFVNNGTGVIGEDYATVHNTYNVAPSTMILEVGEVITLENGVTGTILTPYDEDFSGIIIGEYPVPVGLGYGGTAITVAWSNPTNLHWTEGLRYRRLYAPAVERVRNPIYNAIMNDTLEKMGLTDIAQIDETNIRYFRLLGRLEALKYGMQNTAGDYAYSSNSSASTNYGGTVNSQVIRMFQREDKRILDILDYENFIPAENSDVPDESLSQDREIKVVW